MKYVPGAGSAFVGEKGTMILPHLGRCDVVSDGEV